MLPVRGLPQEAQVIVLRSGKCGLYLFRLAIFALLELAAHPDRQYSVAEIGKKYRISSHHLAKVMHTLGRAGLARSLRGAGGGYQFSGNVRRTTLLDIIELFERLGSTEVDPGETTDEGRALRRKRKG